MLVTRYLLAGKDPNSCFRMERYFGAEKVRVSIGLYYSLTGEPLKRSICSLDCLLHLISCASTLFLLALLRRCQPSTLVQQNFMMIQGSAGASWHFLPVYPLHLLYRLVTLSAGAANLSSSLLLQVLTQSLYALVARRTLG